jgi:hypothetical protein
MARFTQSGGGGSGEPGPAGDSAYDIAVSNGFEGTEQEWIDSLDGAGHGNFVFVTDTMEVRDSLMNLKAYGADEETLRGEIVLNPGSDYGRFRVYDDQTEASFDTSDWATVTWSTTGETSSQLVITGASGIVDYFTNSIRGFNRAISINDGSRGTIDGWGINETTITIYIPDLPHIPNTTITTLDIYSAFSSTIVMDYDENAMNFDAQNMNINMTTTGNRDISIISADDATVRASGDDLNLQAGDDIRFTSSLDNADHAWTMDSEGRLQLPGNGYIENPKDSSGDGYLNDTIKIVPDNLLQSDQYLIIDPTAPNHIHIRAGGLQDYSGSELILGGERAGVHVIDSSGVVGIQSKKEDYSWTYPNSNPTNGTTYIINTELAEPDINDFMTVNGVKYIITSVNRNEEDGFTEYQTTPSFNFITNNNYTFIRDRGEWAWTFNREGYINGPTETGSLRVTGIINDDGDLDVQADQDLILSSGEDNGEYLHDSTNPDNQIATIGDVTTAQGTGANGEVTRWSPNFTATGLAFTGTGATYPTYNSNYVKNGRMVSFNIEVNLSTVTNFGTGQYKLELPFTPQFGFNHFSGWIWADPNVDPDTGTGHTILNADTAGVTDVLDLHYLKQSGGANSPIREALFLQGAPVTLSTISKIYINGTYITAD